MERKAYLSQWRLDPDPFQDEEAKNDAVFGRLISNYDVHPHFGKVYGSPDKPGPAVVFGPKGSGKTALRLQIEHRLREHDAAEIACATADPKHPMRRVRTVAYDDLNPFLDTFKRRAGGRRASDDEVLDRLTLADHMDVILSLAVTGLVTDVLDRSKPESKAARRLDRERRATLALLALFYDEPSGDDPDRRWTRLYRAIRPSWVPAPALLFGGGLVLLALAGAGALARLVSLDVPAWGAYALAGLGVAALLGFAFLRAKAWLLGRKIRKGLRVIERRPSTLSAGLAAIPSGVVRATPSPAEAGTESRYELFRLFLRLLEPLGYGSLFVLIDRIDEPTLVSSKTERMRKVVWPMLDIKFLQQDRIAIKMLLPAELELLAEREGPEFKQRARLDKCNRIELDWGGGALYDLCTARMRACHKTDNSSPSRIELKDLFDGLSREELSSALGTLIHPRNTLKFIYDLIDAQCEKADRDGLLIPRHRLESALEHTVRGIRADLLMGNPA